MREIVNLRSALSGYVPDVNHSSNGSVTIDGKRFIYSYRTIPYRGLLLLRPASVKSAAWRPFLGDLLLAALAGALLAAVLSFAIARSIVRPVRRVAEASHALAAGETPTPVPEEGARELASLAQAFNEMAEQLAASRESERNFLLSVSHELKTPLTAIRGYAEGLGEGAFTHRRRVADDPPRGTPARAARARPARSRADEPARVRGLPRGGGSRRGRARGRRPARGERPRVRRLARRRGRARPGSRATTTGCSRSPRTWSRTRSARRRRRAR